MTIISASYKTDIPAFYGEWFERRLAAKKVEIRNPFNGKLSTVSLRAEDIDGFVFWTRNITPFLPRLEKLIAGRFPFYVQYTLTGYPRLLEASVPARESSLEQMCELSRRFGQNSIVWRYDPILMSSLTPVTFHLENFERLSSCLKGVTQEVVVSFAQFYGKTSRNLDQLTKAEGIKFENPDQITKKKLLQKLFAIALKNGQRLTLCAQSDLEGDGVGGAACIDAVRLGLEGMRKIQGNRPGCLCIASKDIGGYETCPHGCIYCYAVSKTENAKDFFKNHQAESSFLR